MLPHARVVLHQPAMSQRGTIPDLIVEADEVARVRALLEEILAHHTGRTADQVREDTDRDLVLPGQAAVDYGIADAVLTSQVPAGWMSTRIDPGILHLSGRCNASTSDGKTPDQSGPIRRRGRGRRTARGCGRRVPRAGGR